MTFTTSTHAGSPRTEVGFLEPIIRPFADLAAYVRRYNEYARAEVALNRLSDRELTDIGVTRGQIHDRVWSDFDLTGRFPING